MKKMITIRLCLVITIAMSVAVFISCILQIRLATDAAFNNAMLRIDQIGELLEKNDAEMELLKENLKEDYLIRAKAAAYMLQHKPEASESLTELRKVASLLQVDELHLFDKEGTLYTGTRPEYYDYTFRSGEQMEFFLPMLEDYSLELCQDIVPNTAEGKKMQYVAVWREDLLGIVQIGMEPVRLLDAMARNELPHIFNIISPEKGIVIFAADPDTGEIMGTTDAVLTGMNVWDMGLTPGQESETAQKTYTTIGDQRYYCIAGRTSNVLIGVCSSFDSLFQNIPENMFFTIFCLFLVSVAVTGIIMMMLERSVLRGIGEMTEGLKRITSGDLDVRLGVAYTPEFAELSQDINSMVQSLLETTGKLSLAFQNVDIPVAVYEYNIDMKRVMATNQIGAILKIPDDELKTVVADRDLFAQRIDQICSCPFEEEKDLYLYHTAGDTDCCHYLKIKSYHEGRSVLGIIVDMTEEIEERQRIKQERDRDLLTELFSRRAFYADMDRLFAEPQLVKTAALLLVDLDNLKYVNDNFGHIYGDKLLIKAAQVLSDCSAEYKITARLSGDEFILFIYGEDSREVIQEYLDGVYEQVSSAKVDTECGETVDVRMSGGYAFYPAHARGYHELLQIADQTMYRVKKTTKGVFACYYQQQENTVI